jgi:hypothetical protein
MARDIKREKLTQEKWINGYFSWIRGEIAKPEG